MTGFINFLKPPQMTSHDVVAAVRKALGVKVGHGGTLDPGAAGVLPLAVGKATRLLEYGRQDKEYTGELTLGVSTDTLDADGEVLEKQVVDVSDDEIREVLFGFVGEYDQVPPMVSAKKHRGQRLYELNRKGIEIKRKPVRVKIQELHVKFIQQGPFPKVLFHLTCGPGTYVRSLCRDVGEKLGCPAHLSFLCRTRAGVFRIADAVTAREFADAKSEQRLGGIILSPQAFLKHLPEVVVGPDTVKLIKDGRPFRDVTEGIVSGEIVRISDEDGRLLAVGFKDEDYIRPRKVLM